MKISSNYSQHRSRLARGIAFTALTVIGFIATTGGSCNVSEVPGANTPNFIGTPGSNSGSGTGSTGSTGGQKPPVNANDHILGDAGAPITVIEYADFQCPFCGRFARNEFPTLKANYIDTGKVRWVFRHFPLRNIHNRAEASARASECAADQGAFAAYHDLTFGTVDANSATILTDAQLQQHAVTLGLSAGQFNACFPPGDGKAARVQQDVDSGTALGLTGTPTFFVEDQRYTGFKTAAEMSAVFDQLLGG